MGNRKSDFGVSFVARSKGPRRKSRSGQCHPTMPPADRITKVQHVLVGAVDKNNTATNKTNEGLNNQDGERFGVP